MTLSPAATIVLTRAAERPDHRLEFHRKLPTGGRHKMIDALLRDGLVAGDAGISHEDPETGLMLTGLTLTDEGFRAIGREPIPPTAPTATHTAAHTPLTPSAPLDSGAAEYAACESPVPATGQVGAKASLRNAATALIVAWDAGNDLASMINDLRNAVTAARPTRVTMAQRAPRTDTKQANVLAMLRRDEGAAIAQVMETTGWQQHTVRGFFAGLKRKGITIDAIERVRMVGSGKQGSKGSYSIYRLAEAG